MKLCLVSHNFLPEHRAGTEIYTASLAVRLLARGHGVSVFTTEKEISRPHLSVRERDFEGVPVHELVNNLYYESFAETWDEPRIARAFGDFLERERPDLVHFHHLLYLSAGCIEECARRGIPVVFTLHDYWLQCPRFGQRIHSDGSLCRTVESARCGGCLTTFAYAQSPVQRAVGTTVARVRESLGIDLGPLARDAGRWLGGRGDTGASAAELEATPRARELAREVEARHEGLRARVVPHVARFLSPSRFLLEELRAWGIPEERSRHLATGMDLELPERGPRPARGLRFAYVGSLVPVKGVHVLLEAWALVEPALRDGSTLSVFGPAQHEAAYVRELRRRAPEVGATLAGPLEREAVGRTLCETDVLCVPSIWFENAPLVVFEATRARTAVLASELGGLAEMVRPGANGWHFRHGDAGDLARRMTELLREPARLDALEFDRVRVPTVDEQVSEIEAVYREVLDA